MRRVGISLSLAGLRGVTDRNLDYTMLMQINLVVPRCDTLSRLERILDDLYDPSDFMPKAIAKEVMQFVDQIHEKFPDGSWRAPSRSEPTKVDEDGCAVRTVKEGILDDAYFAASDKWRLLMIDKLIIGRLCLFHMHVNCGPRVDVYTQTSLSFREEVRDNIQHYSREYFDEKA